MIARVIALILLAALYSGTAMAQSKSGSSPSSSPSSSAGSQSQPVEAPVGHRQPRASDVPSTEDRDERPLTPEEKAANARLERALKGVCRGC